MTLRKLIFLVTVIIFTSACLGAWLISTHHFQHYLSNTVQNQTINTANGLALSLSKLTPLDIAEAETMVNAVFETGDYQAISLQDRQTPAQSITRIHSPSQRRVPQWFKTLYPINVQPAKALVSQGWQEIGTLTVLPNLSLAYEQLWNNSRAILLWFICLTGFTLLLEYLALELILNPLKKIQEQALNLIQHQFTTVTPPRIHELHDLATTMNQVTTTMAERFKEDSGLIQALRKQAYQDPLTGLANRRYFNRQLEDLLAKKDAPFWGGLILLEFGSFESVKLKEGFQKVEQYLTQSANSLEKIVQTYSYGLTARLSDQTFALVLAYQSRESIEKIMMNLKEELDELLSSEGLQYALGLALYNSPDSRINWMKQADQALHMAKDFPRLPYGFINPTTHPIPINNENIDLIELLKENLTHNRDQLVFQPILSYQIPNQIQLDSLEALFRINNPKGDLISAAQFIHMAENQDLIQEIDQRVIEKVQTLFLSQPWPCPVAINVAFSSLCNPLWRQRVRPLLSSLPPQYLMLEITELKMDHHLVDLQEGMKDLIQTGCLFGLDDFGTTLQSIEYVKSLPLHYVKLASALIKEIEYNIEEQFYLKTLTEAIRHLNMKVMVKGVERQSQQDKLLQFGLVYQQGQWIGKPSTFEAIDLIRILRQPGHPE